MEIECGTAVSFSGDEFISTYRSSDWAERAFCNKCGTHLYIRVLEGNTLGLPEGMGVPPGLFDESEGFKLAQQVFIDDKPDYYDFSNQTKNISSEQIDKMFPGVRNKST